ncbi:hypothetical protein, partial [Cronobacter sakazakii]
MAAQKQRRNGTFRATGALSFC